MTLSAADELVAHRAVWLESLLRVSPRTPGLSDAEQAQFLTGYLKLIESSARGDDGPRDEYLAAVVPGIKASGMRLGFVIRTLSVLNQQLMTLASPPHHDWYLTFGSDYAERLINLWEKA